MALNSFVFLPDIFLHGPGQGAKVSLLGVPLGIDVHLWHRADVHMLVEHFTLWSINYNWYIVSVSHTPNQAELRTLSNVERGAQPRVQHYLCS